MPEQVNKHWAVVPSSVVAVDCIGCPIRAELDAYYARLHGLIRDELRYAARRTRSLALESWDKLSIERREDKVVWLKISLALAKPHAKKKISDETLEVFANTLKINNGIL